MNKLSGKAGGYASISLVCVFWGISFISTKICFQWFTPFSLAATRFVMASIILFIAVKLKEKSVRAERGDYKKLFFAGFTGVFLYFTFENVGLKFLPASLASILLSVIPAFAAIVDRIALKVPLTKGKLTSIALSILGVTLVVGFNVEADPQSLAIGSVLMILSALSWVVYSYMTAPLQAKYSSLTISFYQTFFGAICFCLFLPFNPVNLEGFNAQGLVNLLFLGIICSALCYILYNYAIRHLQVIVCSIFINIMPIVTIIASMFILGERITALQVVGTILIISAVFLITKQEGPESSSK